MKLRNYIRTKNLTYEAFAEFVPPYSQFTVRSWALGLRVPRPEAMKVIQDVTKGAVNPSDFYDLEEAA